MTGDQIIAYAQYGFGGSDTDPTVTAAMWLAFYNMALHEMYHMLPTEELARGSLLVTETLTLTGGLAAYPAAADKILQLAHATTSVPYHPVPMAAPLLMDSNSYLVPSTTVYHLDESARKVFVRPVSVTSALVSYIAPPPIQTVTVTTLTMIPLPYQMALADLMTSYAYAQEEDTAQTAVYRRKAQELISTTAASADSPAPVDASGPAPVEAQP